MNRFAALPLVLAISLLAAACTSDVDAPAAGAPAVDTDASQAPSVDGAQDVSGERVPLGEEQFGEKAVSILLHNLAVGYRHVDGAWTGFDPNDHPTVIGVRLQDRTVVGAIAINHPDVDALGDATALDVVDTPFDTAHRIDSLSPDTLATLDGVANFEFNTVIGGVDSFVINGGTDESFFNITEPDYVSTVLHEMFHRYQGEAFGGFEGVGQDVDGYDYSAENLALATLEERALVAALNAENDDDRDTAARYFAAIRLARIERDERVLLDDAQEATEGSARYIEHKVAGTSSGFVYVANNFSRDLQDEVVAEGVKDFYGFGRWYSSGAAGLELLDRLGVDDFDTRLERGESVASMLAEALSVDGQATESLVNEARSVLDPDGGIADAAARAAETASDEGPVFGDDSGAGGAGGEDGEGIELTAEQLECLRNNGVDLDGSAEITDAQWNACNLGE